MSVLQNLQAVHAASSGLTQHSKSHIVTMATSDSSKPAAQFVPSAFPQGSILVVPHGSSPFGHAVLPMFGSTPMIVQQPVASVTAIAGSKESSVTAPSSSVSTQAVPVITPTSVQASSTTVLQDASQNDKQPETEVTPQAQAVILTNEQAKSLLTNKQTKSLFPNQSNMPIIIPPSLAGSVLSSMVPNYQQAFQYFAPICAMKVTEPVKMEDVNFDCKAIEISGEVPIKKVLIDGNKEDSSEYIEVTDSVSEQQSKSTSSDTSKPETTTPQLAMFEGHSSAEVMSAQLLLSLTGRSENMILQDSRVLMEKAALSKPLTREEAMAISTPVSSSSSSTGRKRKQTPIASARPSVSDDNSTPAKAKRARKPKADDEKKPLKRKTPQKKNAKALSLTPNQLSTAQALVPRTAEDESQLSSQALASMQQLKASRVNKPMKEYVIETDSDSDSSSSGSSSSHANSDSSSESSSDSSSEEEVVQTKRGVANRGRGRGRGRGRATLDRSKVCIIVVHLYLYCLCVCVCVCAFACVCVCVHAC